MPRHPERTEAAEAPAGRRTGPRGEPGRWVAAPEPGHRRGTPGTERNPAQHVSFGRLGRRHPAVRPRSGCAGPRAGSCSPAPPGPSPGRSKAPPAGPSRPWRPGQRTPGGGPPCGLRSRPERRARTGRLSGGCPILRVMWNTVTLCSLGRLPPSTASLLLPRLQTLNRVFERKYKDFCHGKQPAHVLQNQGLKRARDMLPCRLVSNKAKYRRYAKTYPVLDGRILSVYRHVFEENLRNSEAVIKRYSELLEMASKGGGENAILRHTQRNKKLFVRERLKLLLDDESFLELSPLAGLNMPYGDVPAAGCLTGIGKICGVWCVFMANDATVKGGTIYPIGVKKQLRAQEIAMQNRLLSVYLVDSGGAFLPLQSELFPDKSHGGRVFYNEAIMSAMRIPQVAVVCGSCVAGGAYVPTMAEETVIIDKIGTLFLAGPPLVKAATGEDVSPEDLGGAKLHSNVSGCSDHFASSEKEAYECIRNVISTLNYDPLPEEVIEHDSPLYSSDELLGLAPQDYRLTLPVKLILSRLMDGSRFQEFKANYGTTLVTGFGHVEGHLVGVVANNGELSHDASLKGSHFVQLCSQRSIPILFFQNTAPHTAEPTSISQAEAHSNRLKAQASMMAAVACAAVPKITIVIGGCYGSESYVMCGRSFSPNFLFLWPNARVALVDSRHFSTVPQAGDNDCTGDESELKHLKEKLEEESSAFYSSARLWDDGVILPQNTRKVIAQCLEIIEQQKYQVVSPYQYPVIRM